jgi:hypothetical protein
MEAFIAMRVEQRRLLCEQAGNALGLAPASIEKDFWVCWTLRELFGLPIWGEQLAFKGGTSLSKGWKLIERFSEDIDVVISRQFLGFDGETLSNNRQKKLIKTCSARIHRELMPALTGHFRRRIPADQAWSLVPAPKEEDEDQQTLLFEYPPAVDSGAYVPPVVKIEMGARSATEPTESPTLQSYLCETFPDIVGIGTFTIRTVAARRTFWDKVMLLHEETYRPPERAARQARMARHYYDIWSLIRKGVADQALADAGLFARVAAHRKIFFGYRWMDYSTLRPGSLRLLPLPHQVSAWQTDYQSMRSEMFFGDVPRFDEILRVVAEFERRFNSMLAMPSP